MRQPSASSGFTIIEVMIVVTIIAVLLAIVVPSYQNYATRAKVAEGFALVGPIKHVVGEYYADNGGFPSSNAEVDLEDALSIHGSRVGSVEVTANGVVVVTYDDPTLAGETVTLTPTAAGMGVRWTCSSSLPPALLPSSCR
jgi:type IV pilus assembly protein PilA